MEEKKRAKRLEVAINAASPEDPEGRGIGWCARVWYPGLNRPWARVYVKAASRSGRQLGYFHVPDDEGLPLEYGGKMRGTLISVAEAAGFEVD